MIWMIIVLFFAAMLLTRYYAPLAERWGLLDHPNNRSAHTVVKPRGAGIVFVTLWCLFCIFAVFQSLISWQEFLILFAGTLVIATVGYADDCFTLRARTRLAAQIIPAILLVTLLSTTQKMDFGFTQFTMLPIIIPVLIFATIWSINLYNFMDGTDGLAGTEAIFIFTFGGAFLYASGAVGLAIMSFTLSAVVAGFLRWNWPESKVFMGDVGSTALGFLVMAFAILGQAYGVPLTIWLILYGVFWFDTSITLLRRLFKGEKIFQSHKSHAYQRLHQSGFSHQQVLWILIAVNSLLAILACIGYWYRYLLFYCLLASLTVLIVGYMISERYLYLRKSHDIIKN